jgi:hypothetical protein
MVASALTELYITQMTRCGQAPHDRSAPPRRALLYRPVVVTFLRPTLAEFEQPESGQRYIIGGLPSGTRIRAPLRQAGRRPQRMGPSLCCHRGEPEPCWLREEFVSSSFWNGQLIVPSASNQLR